MIEIDEKERESKQGERSERALKSLERGPEKKKRRELFFSVVFFPLSLSLSLVRLLLLLLRLLLFLLLGLLTLFFSLDPKKKQIN